MIAFHELDDALRPALLAASARHFGAAGYQADDRYLQWLYRRNPTSRGLCEGIVAVQDGTVVGCMHRLMLPLRDGRRLAALHNHFVDPAVRSGSGVLLLRRATRDADIAVAPGVEEKLGPIYRRLRFHQIEGAWLHKPLSRARIAAGLVRGRLGGDRRLAIGTLPTPAGVAVTVTPTDPQLAELTAHMRRREGENGIDWSEDLVRWRYFDPQGPRHVLVRSRGSPAYAVLALGRRRGVRTMRLMDCWSEGQPGWTASVERVARKAGAALGLAFATDPAAAAALQASGWRPRADRTFTFSTPEPIARLSAPTTDLGFEAFRADFA